MLGTMYKKRLDWTDKILIGTGMAANSYIVYGWYLKSLKRGNDYTIVDTLFAATAGIALDLGVMLSATGNLKRSDVWYKGWGFWTPLLGCVASCIITYNTYATTWLDSEAAVHMVFPLFVWASSQYVARKRQEETEDWVDEKVKSTIKALNAQVDAYRQQIDEYRQQIDAALSYHKELKQTINRLQQQLEDDQQQFANAMQVALIKNNAQIDALTIERDLLGNRIQELQAPTEESKIPSTVGGKSAIRSLLSSNPELINSPNEIIARLGVDPSNRRAVQTMRTQISQIKQEHRG